MMPVLMLFVDGLGLPATGQDETPLRAEVCPRLMRLLSEDCTPADACLGVPGLPQSATGQTTLLTGINAPARVGRHIEGFPGAALRKIIGEHNIFRSVIAGGGTATFANGYVLHTLEAVQSMRLHSVTTVAALCGIGDVRRQDQLLRGEAVAHDLDRATLIPRGYTGACVSPEQAADDLLAMACVHTFTLFEFFQTDRAGHRCSLEQAEAVLRKYDRFLSRVCSRADAEGLLVLLTSDHGNIEDLSVRTHTRNPVPLAARGPGAAALRRRISSLVDITPAILERLGIHP